HGSRGSEDRGRGAAGSDPVRADAGPRGRANAVGHGAGGGGVSLDEAVDRYLDHVATERGLAKKSVEAYARDLAAFTGLLAGRRMTAPARLGATEIRAHLAALAERGLSGRSQARALAAVRGFLRYLVRAGVLADDP